MQARLAVEVCQGVAACLVMAVHRGVKARQGAAACLVMAVHRGVKACQGAAACLAEAVCRAAKACRGMVACPAEFLWGNLSLRHPGTEVLRRLLAPYPSSQVGHPSNQDSPYLI